MNDFLDQFITEFGKCVSKELSKQIFANIGYLLFKDKRFDNVILSTLYNIVVEEKNAPRQVTYVYQIIDEIVWFIFEIYINPSDEVTLFYYAQNTKNAIGECETKNITFKEFLLKLYENNEENMNINLQKCLFIMK